MSQDDLRITLLLDSSALREFASTSAENAVVELIGSALESENVYIGASPVSLTEAANGLKPPDLVRLLELITHTPQVKPLMLRTDQVVASARHAAHYQCSAELAHILLLSGEYDDADVVTYSGRQYEGVVDADMVLDLSDQDDSGDPYRLS